MNLGKPQRTLSHIVVFQNKHVQNGAVSKKSTKSQQRCHSSKFKGGVTKSVYSGSRYCAIADVFQSRLYKESIMHGQDPLTSIERSAAASKSKPGFQSMKSVSVHKCVVIAFFSFTRMSGWC